MTAFLIDDMFPAAAAGLLRTRHGRDTVHVTEAGLRAADDTQVAAAARAERRAVVTENVADFAAERDLVVVFVLKNLPAGGGQATALARILDRWTGTIPIPVSVTTGRRWTNNCTRKGSHGRDHAPRPRRGLDLLRPER